ncbi:MAG TPA: DUF3667 domain-containing protein [Chthoniobacterales bacterium]
MSDESTRLILGDAAAAASEEIGGRRRFFRRRKKAGPRLTNCENCGAALVGEYCARCGQHAIDYRRSLLRVLVDAADSFFNWDTKFIKSLGVLLAKPWKLTNDFNAGRRARYVHPLRLYLLASIAFFIIARMVNITPQDAIHLDPQDRGELVAALGKLTAQDSILTAEQRAKVEAARTKLSQGNGALTPEERGLIQDAFGDFIGSSLKKGLTRRQRETLKAAIGGIPETSPTPAQIKPGDQPAAADSTATISPTASATLSPTTSPLKKNGPFQFSFDDDKDKNDFDKWMENRIKEKVGEDGTKAQLFLDTLRSNIPTMMLCCIPLFAFVLKLLYVRKRRFYIEHLVYALHIHTFAYVAVVVITLLAMGAARWLPAMRGLLIGVLTMLLFVQVFLSIRRVYGQGWFFTTLKFLLGGFVYFVILITAVAMTAFVTLLLP